MKGSVLEPVFTKEGLIVLALYTGGWLVCVTLSILGLITGEQAIFAVLTWLTLTFAFSVLLMPHKALCKVCGNVEYVSLMLNGGDPKCSRCEGDLQPYREDKT